MGEGRGEKVMIESAPPRQSVVRLFLLVFCFLCFSDIIIFSRAQKYWRETHLLDPLIMGRPQSSSLTSTNKIGYPPTENCNPMPLMQKKFIGCPEQMLAMDFPISNKRFDQEMN
jgi:hypothetical protein